MPTVTLTTDVDTATGLARAHKVEYEFAATASREVDGAHVPPAPFVAVNEAEVDLPALPPGYALRVLCRVTSVRGELPVNLPARYVLAPSEPTSYLDLVDVDPDTLEPVGPAPADAWRAAVQQVATAAAIEAATAALAVLAPELLVSGRVEGRRLLLTDRAGDDVDAGLVVPSFSVGEVATGAPGAAAALTLTGGPLEFVLGGTLPKGDAGGLPFNATVASGTSLDTLFATGQYRCLTSSGPSLDLGYPEALAGVLHVWQLASSVIVQEFIPGGGPSPVRRRWTRMYSGGAWGAWRPFTASRVERIDGGPTLFVDDGVTLSGEYQFAATYVPLGTLNLDTVTQPGTYYQHVTSQATAERNYPTVSGNGVLEVFGVGIHAFQRYTVHSGNQHAGKGIYLRRLNSGVWDPWSFVPSQQIDKSAGVVVRSWDDQAARYQNVYADSGHRDITSTLVDANGVALIASGTLYVDRDARRVTYTFRDVVLSAAAGTGTVVLPGAVPTGFRATGGASGVLAAGNNFRRALSVSNELRVYSTVAGEPLNGTITYRTVDPYPASVPGTQVGGLPNL